MTTLQAHRREDPAPPPSPAYEHVPGPFWREMGALLGRHRGFWHSTSLTLVEKLPHFGPIVADLEREPEHAGGALLDEHLKLVAETHRRFVLVLHAQAVLVLRVLPVSLLFGDRLPRGMLDRLNRDLSAATLGETSLRAAKRRMDATEATLLGWDHAKQGPYPPTE